MNLNIPMPSGYRLLANYRNLVVLAEAENKETPEPYVTWLVINGSDVQMGKYFADLEKAEHSFSKRTFMTTSSVSYQTVSHRGVQLFGKWINHTDLLLHYFGCRVMVTVHGVYSLKGDKICNC